MLFYKTQAGFLVLGAYSWNTGFEVEAKLAGGAGFNIDLSANNPSFSGSRTFNLISAASDHTSIPLAYGTQAIYRFK
jgi:hypothetical protein